MKKIKIKEGELEVLEKVSDLVSIELKKRSEVELQMLTPSDYKLMTFQPYGSAGVLETDQSIFGFDKGHLAWFEGYDPELNFNGVIISGTGKCGDFRQVLLSFNIDDENF